MLKPLVSVLVPCYNHESFIEDCLNSIATQTYPNIELIVIDDGSSDDSYSVIQKFATENTERFRRFIYRTRANLGLATTLSELVELADGSLLAPIASDDQMIPGRIENDVKCLQEEPNAIAVFGTVELIDDQNRVLGQTNASRKAVKFNQIQRHRHYLPAPTMTVSANAYRSLFPLPQHLVIEDWYTLLRLSKLGDLIQSGQPSARYRTHATNVSKVAEKMFRGRLDVIDLLDGAIDKRRATWDARFIRVVEGSIGLGGWVNVVLSDPVCLFDFRAWRTLVRMVTQVFAKKAAQ